MTDRRTGGLGANVDVQVDPQRRTGAVGVTADLAVDPARRVGAVGVMVDVQVQNLGQSIPISAVFSATANRSILATAAFRATLERNVPLTANFRQTTQRSVPLSAQFVPGGPTTSSRSIPLNAEFSGAAAATQRRTGGLGVVADFTVDPQRRAGSLGVTADLALDPQRRLGALGAMVDLETPAVEVVTADISIVLAGSFELVEPLDPEPGPPPDTTVITSSRRVPLAGVLGERLTVPLTMPIVVTAPTTGYEYVWSVPLSGPDCVTASVSRPADPGADANFQEIDAPLEAIYVQTDVSGTAPEGAKFAAFSQIHGTREGWTYSGHLSGYNSWNEWTSRKISSWFGYVRTYGPADRARVFVVIPTPLDGPPVEGTYTATACFTWRGRQEDPNPPPCELVQLTTEWYRVSVIEHVSPRVPYDLFVPIPWQARRFRVWFLPLEGDTSSTPMVAVRYSKAGYLPVIADYAQYPSRMPSRLDQPHYVSGWESPNNQGTRMDGLHMLIMTDDQTSENIPYHQGQYMKASVVIEWDCDFSVGIPISAMFERLALPAPGVQIVG